jgi:thymidylate kinase
MRNAKRRKINNMTEEIQRLQKIQDNYIKLAKEGKHRYFILDANGSIDSVCFNVENTLRYYLYRYYNTE